MCSDETLAAGVQQGNQADLQALVERYYEPLLRFSYWLSGGDQAQAEDMTQETFLRMMRGIAGYDSTRPFKPWLYAIAEHVACNFAMRAEQRRTVAIPDEVEFSEEAPQPEEQAESAEAQQSTLAALRRLPVRQREVIVLFYYQELPQKEIAEMLGVPLGTVKSRLSLGIKQLRAWMERSK